MARAKRRPKLLRDPEDGEPKPTKWTVTFTTQRTIEIEADGAKTAEEKAREAVLFADEFPVDRDEITHTSVGWVNPEREADQTVIHLAGCWGRHCSHYDCDVGDTAIDHNSYCSQCDIEAY